MTCVKFDITVSNDNTDGKLKKAVFQAATNNGSLDFTKATILAGYINNDPKFIELLKQTLSERGKQFTSLLDTHANIISEVLNNYYEQNHLSVENSIAKQHAEALSGFTTSNAKREAIEHTADQILAVYDSEFQKPKQKRMTYAEILEEVKSRIKSTFTNEVFNPLLDILNTNEFKDKPKVKEYLERYETARKEAIDAQKAFKDAKANNLEDSEINRLSEELTTKMSTYRAVQENIINDFTELTKLKSGAAKNYLNLVNLISGSNNWFYTAFTSSKLTNIVKDFETVLEEEKVEDTDATDELDFNNVDINTIDETARSWEDKLYNNFDKHIDAKLKLYLSRLFNLSSPDKVIDNKTGIGRFPKDNTTELGVPMTMHATYCIAQMSVNCNFSSLESFIDSVEKLARKDKKLYGLMQLVEDMRNDESLQWAKFVRSQLDNPKIQKRMIVLKEDGDEVIHSNKAMDPLTLLIYNMQNSAKATIRSKHYDVLKSQLVDRKLKISKLTDTSTDAAIGIHFDFIYNWLTTYFPTIDKNSIRNYVYENKATRSKKIKDLIKHLDTFVAAAEKIRESTVEVPDYSVMDSAIINIAKELVNYSVAKIELNSANAEGNMASDLMKNSYLTNLIKQIEHVDENGFPVGLQNLGNFLAQGEQFRHNPILFGIHRNGIDEPGMFTLNEDGTVIVNEGAKDLIQISLFDGTKDQINANAAMYTGMSKGDYFLTSLLVFNNAIDPSGIYSEGVDNYKKTFGGFFLRTPSDAPKNFIIQTKKYSIDGLWTNKDRTTINHKNRLYNALYNHVYGELNNFVQNLNNVFEYVNGEWISKDNTDLLIDRAHYNKTIVKDGELTGNFFKFLKLFNTNGYNASEAIKNALSLYGGDNAVLSSYKSGNALKLNLANAPYLTTENNRIKLVETKTLTESLETILDNWINNFVVEIENKTTQYQSVIEGKYSNQDVIAAMLNNAVMDMSFDDIFEGDVKYYKDAQDFLKRAKEVQAGGKSYDNTDLNNAIGGTIHDANNLQNASYTIKINGRDTGIKVRNGFRAVTIKNTVRPSDYAEDIKNELKSILSKQMSAEQAEKISNEIAAGYSDPTKTNDAQSYITFEEWIARKEAEGTLDKYADIIEQIYEVREGTRDLKDIDLKNIVTRIQVQKNFYFDKQYDANTGCFYPRQIKNAEFVIIPELVKGTDLETLYNIMRKYDIGQINTAETDKAAKRSVLEFWDNDGIAYPEAFENSLYNDKVIENYYYRYLYKQQDVPQHLVDERNKAGIQILKKVLDNATPEVKKNIDNLMKNYVANIKDDFRTLLNNMGWKLNENGVLVNIKNNNQTLDFVEFYERAKIEAQRLGMDSNFIEYLIPDILGEPSMPNYMNNVATKLESIAQSLFNNAITRQTLPGWHAAQVTAVGHGAKVLDSEGKFRKLKYHPKVTDENGNVKQEAYAEVLIPRWSNLIPKDYDISKLESEGLDIHIGYRIPTEGKQSVSVLKVVGFLDDVYGSTIMVPDEWVTQTGSDFDVDSVYGICYEMFKDTEGNLRIIKPDTDESIEAIERRYCNYITRQLESKISKQEITDEFIKDKTKDLYQTLQDENARARKSNNKAFRKAYNNYEDSLNELPDEDYEELENIEAKYGKSNAWEKYNEIATVFASKPDTTTDEKLKGIYLEVMDAALAMADIVGFTKEKINENYKKFREERSEKVKELYLSARREYVDDVKAAAKESNLVSFEEFSKWSIEEQQSRKARNNEILKSMIDIMSHENSREENYSRSNFDDLTNALKKTKSLIGSQNVERSAYNPFDQIDFFENAVSGRKLKAFSVTRDTFNSICNFTNARLGKEHYIKVTYDLSTGNYNVKNLEDTFGKNNVYHNTENNTVTVTHTRIGNSNGNRNVVGKLLTVYSSQTTAHILDAIKEGAIPNENEFTFGTFKTLIDVGIDYETAIAFLMQPSITRVVEAYNENNSVYLSSTANPINTAIKRIAKDLGLTIKGKAITDYDSMADVRKAINDSQDLKDAFNKVFGAEFDTNKSINEQSFNIDAKLLNRRLKLSNSANNFTSLPDKNTYEVAAFDIATILTFDKLHETTKNIEAIARCAKPDSFGAKQTIRATRKVKEFIVKYITDKGKPIANTIQVGDTDLLSSIYPGIETDSGIDVDKSSYGYLAAFFKYATETSVAANSQLFKTESEQFVDITNAIENKLGGKNLSEEQYKELKQYMVQKVYRSIPLLTTPITLNEFGLITYDIDRIKEITEAKQPDPNTVNLDDFNELVKFIKKDYWENEKYRIFGYSTIQSLDFPIKDINNPTKEEIDAFNKLTPAQKVIWMQQNFKENAGLFEYIYSNMYNQNEARIKGYSTQTLKFNDQIDNIEELFVQFNNAFFNKNPLVRLAAIDLIKYSFVVEGFKFKKGSISKIITNKAMQSDLNQKGMAIIPVMKESMNTTLNMLDSTRDEFIERFIRSHSEIVKEVNIPFGSSIEKEFKNSITINTRNLVYIPYTSQKKNLLEFITLGAEDTKDYIRITRSINKQRKTTLYKVKNTKNGVYLIPLNLLERNETDEISVNNNNNLYPRSQFYNAIINHATRNDVVDLTIYGDTNSENYSVYREYVAAYTIPKNKYEQVNEFETNIDYLVKLTESKDIFERDSASKFINDVNRILDKNPLPGTKNIIYNPSRIIANKVVKGNNVIQHLPTGEEIRTVNITRVDAKKNFKYLDDRTKAMLEKDRIKYPNLYQVELVTEANVKEEYLNKLKANKEAAIVNYSITSPLDDIDLNDEYDYQDIDKVSKKMVEHIQWRHRSGTDENASNVVRQLNNLGIDFKSGVSLENNRKNIYELAAEYFRRKSINLQSQLEEFTTISGDKFAINDPELYKYLRTHPDDYFNLVDVIIEAKTFGDVFKEILDTNISSSDPLTQRYIDEIRNAINKVISNNRLVGKKGAMNLLFNDYIANSFSTNPLIRNNFIKLTDQFGDVDWWDLNLSDIGEVNHKQIQTIVKLVSSILNEATSVLAPKEVANFNKKYDTIMAMSESYNENNIITKDGRLIQIYTDDFIEDKYKFANAARDAEMIYGRYSKEHFEAKLANDKWKLENLEQEVNDNYYRQKIALEERTYKACQHAGGNDFLEYLKIRDELYKDHKDFRSLTPDEKAKHEELLSKMQALKSDFSGTIDRGELRDDEARDRARAISNYEKGIKKLNSDYFEYDERIGFRDTLEYFNKIIKNYEKTHPNETLDMRLKDPTYKEAYDWIYANTIYKLSEDAEKALKAAYGYFMPNTDGKKNGNSTITTILNNNNAYDRYGYIDPRGLSLDDIAKIKASYELDFVSNYNSTVEKVNFIKSIPKDLPIYNDTFYNTIRHPSEFTTEVQKRKNELAKIINKLIVRGLDNNGDLSTEILFNNLSKDELKQLANAYKELKSLKETRKKDKVYNEKLKSLIDSGKITFVGDYNPAYIKNITWFNSQSNNLTTEQKQLWFDIFTEEDYKGNTVANSDIFGYIEAAPEYINYERTEAKKLIENNIVYKPTEYYYDMMDKMSKLGKDKYEEWFDLNHIYNPKTKAWEPLRIWTRREVNPNGSLKGSYSQIATYDNTNRKIADGMENSNYKPYTANYKIKPNESGIDTNKYANSKYTNLSKKERAMHELLQTTLNFYTIDNESASHAMKSFVKRGYLPRRAKYEPDAKYYISQALGSVGLEFRETGETEWTQYMDYAHDRDINFDMLKNLKQKGYQEQLPIPERNEGENNADYEKRIKDIRDKNKEIREANSKLEQEILDRDWKGVMNDFITKSIEYNARNKAKNSIYLLLEDLKTRGAYDLSNYNKVPIKDNRGSVKESAEYQTISQKNAIGITENWMRRIIYGQFKKIQRFTKYADLMQNITSAKYMIFNVTGGIANIGTGVANIFNEVFANKYFNMTDWGVAQREYFSNSLNIIADMYKPTSNNETAALLKMFDIVNFDDFNERRTNESASEYTKRIRESLYFMQSTGEHYMQNTVLLAMLNSHRIFKDINGTPKVGSFNDYIWNIEIDTMKKLLQENKELYQSYVNFIKEETKDIKNIQKYDSLQVDFNATFLKRTGDRNLINKYIATRKEAVKNAKTEFNKAPLLREQFSLTDGVITIKPDSELTGRMFGEFKEKVKQTNKLIHGVYDKIGAAKIESEWWGGLVMQYHKHIYPGILKRWRNRGMYNELRESPEKGSYNILGMYLSTEFREAYKRIKGRKENQDNVAIASIQEIGKAAIDTVLNLRLNYNLLPIWEQNAMKRCLGDLLGATSAFLIAIAIHMVTDDDEIQENDFYATVLYMADRLNSEAQMYTPWGLWTEASTLWSSPIAAQNGPKDLIKGLSIGIQALYDEDFNINYTTGLYKGQNKLAVLLYRNTPIYRVYQRLSTMDKNNSYYRINETAFNIKFAKTIADEINPD